MSRRRRDRKRTTRWRPTFRQGVQAAAPVFLVIMVSYIAALALLAFDDHRGPSVGAALSELPPPPGFVDDGSELVSSDQLARFGYPFVAATCRGAPIRFWTQPESGAIVAIVLCRTGGMADAVNAASIEHRTAGCLPPTGLCLIGGDGIDAYWHGSVEDVVVIAEFSNTADTSWFEGWTESVEAHLAAVGFVAPAFSDFEAVVNGTLVFGTAAAVLLLIVRTVAQSVRARTRRLRGTPTFDVGGAADETRWRQNMFQFFQIASFIVLPLWFLVTLSGTGERLVDFGGGRALAILGFFGMSALYLRWTHRDEQRRRLTRRHQTIGPASIAYAVVGVVVFALGLSVYGMIGGQYGIASAFQQRLPGDLAASVAPATSFLFGIFPLALVSVANVAFRRAQRARLAAIPPEQLSPESSAIVLRSFGDDRLRIAAANSARRGATDAWSVRATDRFEEVVAWELSAIGGVVTVSEKKALGAVRAQLDDEVWRDWVSERIRTSAIVAVMLGDTPGLGWELGQIVHHGALDKTVFVVPPRKQSQLAERWTWFRQQMNSHGVRVEPLDGSLADYLVFTVDPDGAVSTYAPNRRDEAGYQVAINAAVAHALKKTTHR